MKLHVGCGTIYLKGWTNMDVPAPNVFFSWERPDLVKALETTEDNYYGRHDAANADLSRFRAGPKIKESVCDIHGTFMFMPIDDNAVDEILSRQVFEHMDLVHAKDALIECRRVLKDGGLLRIDVPDTIDTLNLLLLTKDRFYIRHFIGPVQKGDWGHHCMAYTREELRNFVEAHGFEFVEEEDNIHIYPAFCLKFRKKA